MTDTNDDCGLCGGSGEVQVQRHDDAMDREVACPDCMHRDYEESFARLKAENDALRTRAFIPVDPENGKPLIVDGMKAIHIGEYRFSVDAECGDCIADGPQKDCPVCQGEITHLSKVTVPWTTCKEIYKAMAQTAMVTPEETPNHQGERNGEPFEQPTEQH